MFILNVFGPVYKYRLELLRHACYDIRELIYILTDKISYEKFYTEYHNDFKFVMIDDIKCNYEKSEQYELIPNVFENEEHHFNALVDFFTSHNKKYVFDLHRYIFPYFWNMGIKKFFIIDSDLFLINDKNVIMKFLDTLPEKTIFSPLMGDFNKPEYQHFWNSINVGFPKDLLLNKQIPFYDGWVRGFNFDTLEDMKEFFELWTIGVLKYIEQLENDVIVGDMTSGEVQTTWSTEWIFCVVSYYFNQLKKYTINSDLTVQPGHVLLIEENRKRIIGLHTPRPEDNLFPSVSHRRGAWWDYNFIYDNKRTIENFILNNKEELRKYYENFGFNVKITDKYAYTSIRP